MRTFTSTNQPGFTEVVSALGSIWKSAFRRALRIALRLIPAKHTKHDRSLRMRDGSVAPSLDEICPVNVRELSLLSFE